MSALTYEKDGHIAIVTINRPEARNAMSPEVIVRLDEAWKNVHDDDEVRVAIITGSGDKAFCSGADLGKLIPLFTGARKPEDEWDEKILGDPMMSNRSLLRNYDTVKPVIAAVNGFAIAGGMEMLQGTDIRVASETAKFGLQEVKWAIFPVAGSTVRLPRQIPYSSAMELLLTGNLIDADRALRLGLVNHVVPQDQVMAKAMELAKAIAQNGPIAVREIRRSVRECIGMPEIPALELEQQIGMPVFATRDAREGPKAFMEKRKPQFEGR